MRPRQSHCYNEHPLEGPEADVIVRQRDGRIERECWRCKRIRERFRRARKKRQAERKAMNNSERD